MSGEVMMYYTFQKINPNLDYMTIKKIVTYHAGNKLKYYHPTPSDPPPPSYLLSNKKRSHYKNKQIAKYHCLCVLINKGDTFLEEFKKAVKRDDLADAYLMALAYIKFEMKDKKELKDKKKQEKKEKKESG
jgi:hypothetical protein